MSLKREASRFGDFEWREEAGCPAHALARLPRPLRTISNPALHALNQRRWACRTAFATQCYQESDFDVAELSTQLLLLNVEVVL